MGRNLSTTDQILRYARYRGNTMEEVGVVQVLGKAKSVIRSGGMCVVAFSLNLVCGEAV